MTGSNKDLLEREALAAQIAAGTATEAERAALAEAAADDPEAEADLVFWRAVAAAARAEEAEAAAAAPPPPGARGWERLEAAIRAEEAAPAAARTAPLAAPAAAASSASSAPPRPRAGRPAAGARRPGGGPGVWRPLAIAASVLVALQAGLLLSLDPARQDGAPPPGALRGAIGPQDSALAPERLAVVAFRPEAEEADLRRLLLETQARIVDGPSAIGLYTLAFADKAARDAALGRYAAQAALVESADPLEARP